MTACSEAVGIFVKLLMFVIAAFSFFLFCIF